MQILRSSALLIGSFALLACVGDVPKQDVVDGGPDGVGLAAACTTYCDSVVASCTAANEQFESAEACNTYCNGTGVFGLGTEGDADGNSVACRTYHVGAAKDDPDTHCGHSGPVGGDTCGSYCNNYCDMAIAHCTGDNEIFANKLDCVAYCGADGAAWATGAQGDTDGNSVNCRIYHLGAAAAAPADHCQHAGTTGANTCGTYCENYCALAIGQCVGGNQLYANQGECETACAGFPTNGNIGDAEGDTVQCRLYHLGAAVADPDTHCEHGGQDGAGVCGVAETIAFTFTTTQTGGNYQPKNIVAVWLEESNGTFVKTIGRWADVRKQHLVAWNLAAGANDVDSISGATRLDHAVVLTANYGVGGLADGAYNIRVEVGDRNNPQNGENHYATFAFTKNGTAYDSGVIGAQDGLVNVQVIYSGR